MTCKGCDRAFTKSGMGAQAGIAPDLCKACCVREACFHGYHQPDVKCLDEFMEGTR